MTGHEPLIEALRPHSVWVNKHTQERTVITDFEARTERVPIAAGGFADEHQLVVHHTANVPPGFARGYGDDALNFTEHWEPRGSARPLSPERDADSARGKGGRPGVGPTDSSPAFDPLPAAVVGLADRLSYPIEFDESVTVLFDGPNRRLVIRARRSE